MIMRENISGGSNMAVPDSQDSRNNPSIVRREPTNSSVLYTSTLTGFQEMHDIMIMRESFSENKAGENSGNIPSVLGQQHIESSLFHDATRTGESDVIPNLLNIEEERAWLNEQLEAADGIPMNLEIADASSLDSCWSSHLRRKKYLLKF